MYRHTKTWAQFLSKLTVNQPAKCNKQAIRL